MRKFDSVSNEHACLVTQLKWNSYLSISNMIPNLLVLFFNATCGHKFSLAPRLVIGQIIIIAIFAGTDAMTWVDTDEYQVWPLTTFLSIELLLERSKNILQYLPRWQINKNDVKPSMLTRKNKKKTLSLQ